MAPPSAAAPTLENRQTKAAFDLFKELKCNRGKVKAALEIGDVARLEIIWKLLASQIRNLAVKETKSAQTPEDRDRWPMAPPSAAAPTLKDHRTKAAFDLFTELKCIRDGGHDAATAAAALTIDNVARLDVEKMMARALDCLAAVCEAQRVRVALKQPLMLQGAGDALTSEQQAARNKVFKAALNAVAEGLTHDGAAAATPSFSMEHLLRAFPDRGKLADGRGWLPMHWAVVTDEETGDVTEADVMCVYETDPMALRKHHLVDAYDEEVEGNAFDNAFGYTAAHLLCGLEMTARNMSLVRQLSELHPRAFTMEVDKVSAATMDDDAPLTKTWSALHVACLNGHRTEGLLRLLVQLDASQMKSIGTGGGPLGALCRYSTVLDERLFQCLVEADSSVEVVYDAITGCFASKSLENRVQAVTKLLEVNPAAAQHKDAEYGYNLAHHACFYSNRMTANDCIAVLKLVLARRKDALKEVERDGELPAHHAAWRGPVEVLDFVLGEYPEAATAVDDQSQNLLHFATRFGPKEHRAATVRLLCARYPHMMLQRCWFGNTPLLQVCRQGCAATARLLCEAGGQEAASAAVVTHAHVIHNGWLPLHCLIENSAATLISAPFSEAADAFRLLLRLYPEAAGTEGGGHANAPYGLVGYKKTPYQLAIDMGLPPYYRRLLLRAAPHLDPAELRHLAWAERRMAMFVAFSAVARKKNKLLLARLRVANKDLVKHVVSYL